MNETTLLLRQINPGFVQSGRVSSQAFRPTPKDEKKLSVYDGDKISASDSFDHFSSQSNCTSCGVMAVSCQDCYDEELKVLPDPKAFPEHVLIDFTGLGNTKIKKVGGRLANKARTRGWLYQP